MTTQPNWTKEKIIMALGALAKDVDHMSDASLLEHSGRFTISLRDADNQPIFAAILLLDTPTANAQLLAHIERYNDEKIEAEPPPEPCCLGWVTERRHDLDCWDRLGEGYGYDDYDDDRDDDDDCGED